MATGNRFIGSAFSLAFVAGDAGVRGDISALPVASIAPDARVESGTIYIIKSLESGAYVTTYCLERISDRSTLVVDVTSRGRAAARVVVGTAVTATALSTGILLAAGSEALAFVPNALGRVLSESQAG